MTSYTQVFKQEYDDCANNYAKMEDLPSEMLVKKFLTRLLRRIDVSGKRILDLGGGSGTYARLAVELGASSVVVVDLSAGMAQVGTEVEAQIRPGDQRRIEYHVADCGKPLGEAGIDFPKESFDIVMGNWLLCYAETPAGLEGMWQNIVTYLEPGGQYIGTIDLNIRGKSGTTSKYGITHRVVGETSNGLRIQITAHTTPEIQFGSFLLQPTTLYRTVPESMGMGNVEFEFVTVEDIPEGRSREFWQDFLDEPVSGICTATKAR